MVNNSVHQLNEQRPVTSNNNIKMTMTYGVGNPGAGLWQTQEHGGVKPVNEIPTLPIAITGSPTVIQI